MTKRRFDGRLHGLSSRSQLDDDEVTARINDCLTCERSDGPEAGGALIEGNATEGKAGKAVERIAVVIVSSGTKGDRVGF